MPPRLIRCDRMGGLKSRTGCKTCKIRRVKCGEEKPQCLRCSSTGRKCDYADWLPTQWPSPVSVARTIPTSAVQRERRSFEYYYFHAAPALSDALDLGFWRGSVLQICGAEPAVWDAVVALSTFYENPLALDTLGNFHIERSDRVKSTRGYPHREALVWYSRSLEKLQRQIQRGTVDAAVALVSCVLYLCIELLLGNIKAALSLYRQGAQLRASLASASKTSSFLSTAITPVFLRIGTLATIVGGVPPTLGRVYMPLSTNASRPNSLSESRTELYALVTEWKVFDSDCNLIRHTPTTMQSNPGALATLMSRQEELEKCLVNWYQQFSSLEAVTRYMKSPSTSKPSPSQTNPHNGIIATLFITYTAILILTQTALSTTEMAYDTHETNFKSIISHAPTALAATAAETGNQPPFVFDMGISTPLFITALKCRCPSIRRQALRFLCQAPPVQGMYLCRSAARLLAAVTAVEEQGTSCTEHDLSIRSVLGRPGHVPVESERVYSLRLIPSGDEDGMMRSTLQYSRRRWVEGRMEATHHEVVLPIKEVDAESGDYRLSVCSLI